MSAKGRRIEKAAAARRNRLGANLVAAFISLVVFVLFAAISMILFLMPFLWGFLPLAMIAYGTLLGAIVTFRVIRRRLSANRFFTFFLGLLAAPLGGWAGSYLFGLPWLLFPVLSKMLTSFDLAPRIALLACTTLISGFVSRWTFLGVRSHMTRQGVQAMWLRRFQTEGPGNFRVSEVVDKLSGSGISAMTLQDRDVTLSFEQRRAGLALAYWKRLSPLLFVLPIGFVILSGLFGEMFHDELRPQDSQTAREIALFFSIPFLLVFLLMTSAVFLTQVAFSGNAETTDEEFGQLVRRLDLLAKGERPAGAQILRVQDRHWEEIVIRCLRFSDVVIIDVSNITPAIEWEISQSIARCGEHRIVPIRSAESLAASVQPEGTASAAALLSIDCVSRTIVYPASRNVPQEDKQRFARSLQKAIYAIIDEAAAENRRKTTLELARKIS